ncbi:MAG TPA: protein kinase [Kofleriaceae bacterium]
MKDDHTEVATVDGKPHLEAEDRDATEGMTKVQAERYKVLSRLGKGGMGEVMSVRDEVIGREVALKRIRKAAPSDRLIARFMREATIQGRLEHPSIVPLYDIGRDETGLPYFTMKKLTGPTLSKIFERDRREWPLNKLLRAFVDVCLAVEFAHVRGVVHRDLKPDNIVLGEYGEVSVIDWGVAKIIGDDADWELGSSQSSQSGKFETIAAEAIATQHGQVIGSPGYMAPEQVKTAADIDGKADVYALGCVLFEALACQMLHPTGKAGMASATSGIDARPSVRAPERIVPPELDELCVRACALQRDERPTARELGESVQRYLDGDRDMAMRHKLAGEHLARAQTAFIGGDAQRAVAMREAASAIALDPKLTAAAELVGRLMLEPPRETPADVLAAIREDDVLTIRDAARTAIRGYILFMLMTPLLWWIAPQGSKWVLLLSCATMLNLGLAYWGTKTDPLGKEWMLGIANGLVLACVSHMYTPFLIAPGLAAMSVMGLLFTPTRSMLSGPTALVIVTIIAVLGPWALELSGVVTRSTSVTPGVISMAAPAIAADVLPVYIVGAAYVVALLVISAGIASQMRDREREAKKTLHLQAWQLRQLVER